MAILLSRKRVAPGSQAMMMMFVSLAIWTLGYAMIMLSTTMAAKVTWLKIENIGIVMTPVFWLIFTIRYSRNDRWLPRPVLALFFLVPAITLVLLFSGRWFTLVLRRGPRAGRGLGTGEIERGSWYLVQLIQSYVALVARLCAAALADVPPARAVPPADHLRSGGPDRAARSQFPYQRGGSLLPQWDSSVDLTPISFMIAAVLVSVGVIGLRLFDLIPIARNVVIENIPEMVLVVDSYNRILDANQVTFSWSASAPAISLDAISWKRLAPGRVLRGISRTAMKRARDPVPEEPPRTYELTISPLSSRPGVFEGRVIVAHDVTARKAVEDELTRANAALTLEIAEKELLQEMLRERRGATR